MQYFVNYLPKYFIIIIIKPELVMDNKASETILSILWSNNITGRQLGHLHWSDIDISDALE